MLSPRGKMVSTYDLPVRYCVSQVLERCKSDVDFFNLRVAARLGQKKCGDGFSMKGAIANKKGFLNELLISTVYGPPKLTKMPLKTGPHCHQKEMNHLPTFVIFKRCVSFRGTTVY